MTDRNPDTTKISNPKIFPGTRMAMIWDREYQIMYWVFTDPDGTEYTPIRWN